MNLPFVHEGVPAELQALLGGITPYLHLFQNDLTPDVDTTLMELTEASFDGYMAIGLNGMEPPTPAYDNVNGWWAADYGQKTFTRSASGTSQTCYGWYITMTYNMGTYLLAVGRFSTPKVFTNEDDAVTLQPVWALGDVVIL